MPTVFGEQPDIMVGISRYLNCGYSEHLQRAQCESRRSVGLRMNEWLGERAREYRRVKGSPLMHRRFARALVRSSACALLVCLFIGSPACSLTRWFVRLRIPLFIHAFVRPLVRLLSRLPARLSVASCSSAHPSTRALACRSLMRLSA